MLPALEAIRDLTNTLSQNHLAHWLFGGWALDFHVGRVTRVHDDIDIIIWQHDQEQVQDCLIAGDFLPLPSPTTEHRSFTKYAQRIEVSFIERTTIGTIITPGRWSAWPWAMEDFQAGTRQLAGVGCPLTSVASIIATKRGSNLPVRAKDQQDVRLVEQLGLHTYA